MDILAISDIHGCTGTLRKILDRESSADICILGGDLTQFGSVEDARDVVDMVRNHTNDVLAVAGNCDSADIDGFLSREGISVHGEGRKREQIGFFGVSAMPPWLSSMYQFTEEEIDVYLKTGYERIEDCEQKVLVSHTPPYKSGVDQTSDGNEAGSKSVRKWVQKVHPDLVLCGHIHEAKGWAWMGETPVVNTGPARDGSCARVALRGETVDVDLKSWD